VFLSTHRDAAAARRFFKQAITTTKVTPMEVVTDRALASHPAVRQQPS
jgi:transposase, IS6 family